MKNIVEGSIAIIYKDTSDGKKFLVVKNIPSGNYTFPGGAKEDHEDNLESLLRELKEELNFEPNINVVIDTKKYVQFIFNKAKKERTGKQAKYKVFTVKIDQNTIKVNANEIAEQLWLSKDEAKKKITFTDEGIILDKLF